MPRTVRNLVVVLGDQLDRRSSVFEGLDAERDRVWMAEVAGESTHVWSHKARITMFLASMRHFAAELRDAGVRTQYRRLGQHHYASLGDALRRDLGTLAPRRVVMVKAGEHRVQREIELTLQQLGVDLDVRPDRHFLCSDIEFDSWARGRRQLRLESFYRDMRRRTGVLMRGDQPAGGRWNYDRDNRRAFGRDGPRALAAWPAYPPDAITRSAIADVQRHFEDHPGSLDRFDWPVTRVQARGALGDFVSHRLPSFGPWQDAMWAGEPFLSHSGLSAALNLKLVSPREVIAAVEDAYASGEAPLQSAEGFIRQVLGWREFVRGIYWREMPGYLDRNALRAENPLPGFYWTGDTDMACLREAIGQTLEFGYAHHIQRLMVTGLFALLLGVEPRRVHEWYLAVYVDAVEWAELPNTLGMSQYADDGLLASKPYVASGKYIQRMSNYCAHCRFNPAKSTGDDACPFTTLYWDFLQRHEKRFAGHPRTALQWRSLQRMDGSTKREVRRHAERLRDRLA